MSKEITAAKIRNLLNKLSVWHRIVAIVFLNTVLLFVGFNVLVSLALTVRTNYFGAGTPTDRYSEQALASVYPEYSPQERKAIIAENWARPFLYSSYVLLREAPYQGKYLNVTDAGFRKVKNQGPWPPDPANINVFVFGGSTAFGYGVADGETIASYLQEGMAPYSRRRVCAYNFGVASFYSTQERILFERLLTQGHKPDIAIFVDGLNDLFRVEDDPAFSGRISANFDKSPAQMLLGQLPMMRILRKVQKERGETNLSEGQIQTILRRYLYGKKLIEAAAHEFGIIPVFVWQPVPCYKYDTKHHLFYWSPADYQAHARGYESLERIYKADALGRNFLWCANLQQDEKECLYVDIHHYTAKFSKKLADSVCRMCIERGIIKEAGLETQPIQNKRF